jgi:hypothetical protein
MVVYFKGGATDGYDINLDASKLENDYLNLFSHRQGDLGLEKYAISALDGIDCSREILLGLEKFNPGTYTFSFGDLESFTDPYLKFTLVDNYAGKSVQITDTTAYDFQVTADEAASGIERFKVNISRQEINGGLAVTGFEGCDVREAKVTVNDTENHVTYQPYHNGAEAGDAVAGSGGDLFLSLDKDTFAEAGVYEIAVKAFDQCNEEFLEQKATVEIVDPVPVEIQTDGNTLISSYSGGSQQWSLDGVEIPGATGQQLAASESGLYSVMVTTEVGCTLSGQLQFVITGTETVLHEGDIRVYPNPFDGVFQVDVETSEPAEVRIFNTLGELVTGRPLQGSGRFKSASIDLSSKSDGVYIMYVQVADAVRHVKIIKGTD